MSQKDYSQYSQRVFALRKKMYMGCGFHWWLEEELDWIIHTANNFDNSCRELAFIERLEEIEKEVRDQ